MAAADAESRRCLELYPQEVPTRLLRGEILLQLRRPAEAVAVLSGALETEPMNVGVLMQLGRAYRAVGRPREAEAQFHRVIELQPDHQGAAVQLDQLALASRAHSD